MASAPNENVQFTVYRPKTLVPETWQTLLAFAHRAEAPVDGLKEKFDPVREVQAQAAAILGKSVEAYQKLVQDSAQPIPREGELCFAPEADGIEFNPPRRTFVWRESVHLEVFLVRAPAALAGLTIRGRLSVFLGNLLIGEVPLNFLVGTGGVSAETADSMEAEVGHHYRRIFASYSHKDAQVVGELQSYARMLGDDYLRDVSSLRAGEDWNERLMELIRTADVFQLFWSWNSIDSPFVRQEYEYATRLGRENFIRPVYWEEPLPARPEKNLPPDELRRLHFHRLPTQPAPPESRRTDSGQAAPLAGAKSSSQKFIARNRAPRVQIEYDLDCCASAQKFDLPFVLGVMADLSGKPEESNPPVSDRKMLEIDVDNFDDRMKGFKPRVAFQVPNTLTGHGNLIVDLSFQSMDDFSPGAVARKVGALSELLGARTKLANLLTHVDDETRNRPHAAERTLAELAELDRKLTEQVNPIIHHEDFQKLEGSWRGLYHLVTNTETDEKLKIRVMSISKKEAGMALKKFKRTAWDQSPLFKIIYENEFGTPGGTPFGCLIGDYEFDHSASDVEMLGEVAKISAAAHTPFITAAAPSLCNMENWQELSNPRDLTKIFGTPEHAAWRSLRESEDAKYIGMTLPRFLSRVPYGKKTAPVEEFDFEEETERADTKKYTWSNAAYAMGVNIARAFTLYGWCARIWGVESGGLVEGLPVYRFPTDDGGMDMKCPTEIGITDCREAELGRNGFLPMLHWKNRDYAVFIGAQSLHKPAKYDDPVANANANLSARLPYLFAAGRFAHFLQCIVRDKIGAFRSVDDMTDWLNRWLASYVESDPGASDSMLAQRPFSHAQIRDVVFDSANCFVTANFIVLPRYQLEALTQPLRLKMKFPAQFSAPK